MNCPACREPMITVEFERVETDHCLRCGGIWLDKGEWELLAGAGAGPGALGPAPNAERLERARPCPICDRRMAKASFASSASVPVDACGKGHGIWFDRGELAGALDGAGREPVADLLRQMYRQTFEKEAGKR